MSQVDTNEVELTAAASLVSLAQEICQGEASPG